MSNHIKCKSLVLKVASRCNLNCTYCYMYNLGDNTYKSQPKFMSDETVDAILQKVLSHCTTHGIKKFDFVFHGGEPLLVKPDFYYKFIDKAKAVLYPTIKPSFAVQTNGILVDDEWCKVFSELNIAVGVSIDGTPEANDMYRIDHKGVGSYEKIVEGIKVLQNSKLVKSFGTLTVMNVLSNPVEVYNHFKDLRIGNIDFLFPDNTYDNLPVGLDSIDCNKTPYADWLIAIFDKWYNEKTKKPRIALFESIILALMGLNVSSDAMGNGANEILVIETDGGIEPIDSLKACGEAFTKIGSNINTHEIDEALGTNLAELYNLSHKNLPLKCKHCPISEICGGGYLTHRYNSKNGFDNPSIYCNDLLKLITHIYNCVIDGISTSYVNEEKLEKLDYNEIATNLQQKIETNSLALLNISLKSEYILPSEFAEEIIGGVNTFSKMGFSKSAEI